MTYCVWSDLCFKVFLDSFWCGNDSPANPRCFFTLRWTLDGVLGNSSTVLICRPRGYVRRMRCSVFSSIRQFFDRHDSSPRRICPKDAIFCLSLRRYRLLIGSSFSWYAIFRLSPRQSWLPIGSSFSSGLQGSAKRPISNNTRPLLMITYVNPVR